MQPEAPTARSGPLPHRLLGNAWIHQHLSSAWLDNPLSFSEFHGIQPLLGWALDVTPPADWPAIWHQAPHRELSATLLQAWRRERTRELFRRRELHQLLPALQHGGLRPLLLKGSALAYQVYPHPALRPRCDTDLLVAPGEQQNAIDALQQLGYQRATREPWGERLCYQTSLYRQDEDSVTHAVDLHWRISNRQALADTLDYSRLAARSQSLAALPGARIPCPIHLLLHACLHRAAHLREQREIAGVLQNSGNRLLWLYDIHLLSTGLDADDWRRLLDEARARGLRALLADGLRHSQAWFATPVPKALLEILDAPPREPAAAYLRASPLAHLLADFRALDWRGRRQLAREMLLPPAESLGWDSPGSAFVAFLYLRRIARGVCRRLLPTARRTRPLPGTSP